MAVAALGSAPRVKVAPWNDPVIRGWVFQVVVGGLVGLLAWYLVSNTLDNEIANTAMMALAKSFTRVK